MNVGPTPGVRRSAWNNAGAPKVSQSPATALLAYMITYHASSRCSGTHLPDCASHVSSTAMPST